MKFTHEEPPKGPKENWRLDSIFGQNETHATHVLILKLEASTTQARRRLGTCVFSTNLACLLA
jgi:hypothetical protein